MVSSICARICFTRPSIALDVPPPSTIVVLSLSIDDLLGLAEILELEVLELDAEVLGDRRAAGQDRDVFQHRLAAIAEARRFHGGRLQRAAQLVDDERGERLAFDVLGNDQQRPAQPRDLLEHRQQVLHRRRFSFRG